jgi:hypothetical protein
MSKSEDTMPAWLFWRDIFIMGNSFDIKIVEEYDSDV